jgi:hypothetical protein
VDELKDLRDRAEAFRLYAKQRDYSLAMQNDSAEIKIRAERRLGELLAATVRPGNPELSNDSTIDTRLPEGVSRDQSSAWQRIATIPEDVFEEYLARTKALNVELTTAGVLYLARSRQICTALFSSKSQEWYTPSVYVEAAREVLGGIDLDPASSAADDGLAQPWAGRVWLNPPYAGQGPRFVAKLIEEYEQGHVTAAVLLVAATGTSTQWFRLLWGYTLCFTDHRLNFTRADGFQGSTVHGSIFVYLGPYPHKFAAVFSKFGAVVRRWPASLVEDTPNGGQ